MYQAVISNNPGFPRSQMIYNFPAVDIRDDFLKSEIMRGWWYALPEDDTTAWKKGGPGDEPATTTDEEENSPW
jgi:hypothetical protein